MLTQPFMIHFCIPSKPRSCLSLRLFSNLTRVNINSAIKNPLMFAKRTFTHPTSSTQRLTSSAPRPPSHILPRPGKSASSTSSGTTWSYYTVVSGDSLSAIAARFYGSFSQWQRIYQSNRGTIGNNPNLIYPGERLAIKC